MVFLEEQPDDEVPLLPKGGEVGLENLGRRFGGESRSQRPPEEGSDVLVPALQRHSRLWFLLRWFADGKALIWAAAPGHDQPPLGRVVSIAIQLHRIAKALEEQNKGHSPQGLS
jgi:hypothetical protein